LLVTNFVLTLYKHLRNLTLIQGNVYAVISTQQGSKRAITALIQSLLKYTIPAKIILMLFPRSDLD